MAAHQVGNRGETKNQSQQNQSGNQLCKAALVAEFFLAKVKGCQPLTRNAESKAYSDGSRIVTAIYFVESHGTFDLVANSQLLSRNIKGFRQVVHQIEVLGYFS